MTVIVLLIISSVVQAQTVSETIAITALVPSPTVSSGGGGSSTEGGSQDTGVLFRGIAYPGSPVQLLQNGRMVAQQPAGPDATFSISLSGLRAGSYVFGIRGEDSEGRRSTLYTYTIIVTSGVTVIVQGIFLPPTVSIDKKEVRRGDVLTVLGKTAPGASVTVVFNSETQLIKRAIVDSIGNWVYKLNTLELDVGEHETKAQAENDSDITPFSQILSFKVGAQTVLNDEMSKLYTPYDLNKDGRVNLVDFSMLVYWYRRVGPPIAFDFNSDGQITLTDISIMMYHWTG